MERSYGEDAIESWRRRGATFVEFWCLSPRCRHRHSIQIADAIQRWGEGTLLVMLARRSKCGMCRRQGCHVQVSARTEWGRLNWLGE